jgi:hypothetical protein
MAPLSQGRGPHVLPLWDIGRVEADVATCGLAPDSQGPETKLPEQGLRRFLGCVEMGPLGAGAYEPVASSWPVIPPSCCGGVAEVI